MSVAQQIVFKPFRLDPDNACLWRGTQRLSLTPKAFMVLHYLVIHHGQLATKDAILEAVWPDTIVGDAVLKVCVREIRQKLGDSARTPRFIATEYRQGYRFIRPVATAEIHPTPKSVDRRPVLEHASDVDLIKAPSATPSCLVGRERALAHLNERFEIASEGMRQLIFVTGEAGIGKTALMQALGSQLEANAAVHIVNVQCSEQYGPSEDYLPILEALGRLCRAPGGDRFKTLLPSLAPTWWQKLPWLSGGTSRDGFPPEMLRPTRERMLREIGEVIETLAAETTLVLLLEDLHWADYATLDLISFLAWRQEPARLLMIGSYRPVEVIVSDHPLKKVKQTLELQKRCAELPLELLREHEVAQYLEVRFQGGLLPISLVHLINLRTDGNPLFLVNIVDYLLSNRLLVLQSGQWKLQTEVDSLEIGVPESLREMIEQQIDRLTPDEQRVLEAASVLGMEFSAASVAAALEQDLVQIETWSDRLARRHQFLRAAGTEEWPDSTVTARYRFLHWLHQHVTYQRIGVAKRIHLHLQIGRRLERAYHNHIDPIVSDLTVHFARGREYHRAVLYLQYAAEKAALRLAYHEAIDYLTRSLELIECFTAAERGNFRKKSLKQLSLLHHTIGDEAGAKTLLDSLAKDEMHVALDQQQSLFGQGTVSSTYRN